MARAGWALENREFSDLEWWADELWLIRSTWRPTDYRLFLTFLVDPSHEGNRAKGQAVWSLGASREKPDLTRGLEFLVEVSLKTKFKERIKQFVEEFSELRNRAT